MALSYLLDTNICIYIINHRPPSARAKFAQYTLEEIGISSITASELMYGVIKSQSSKNSILLEEFLCTVNVFPYDMDCVKIYGQIRWQLEQQGTPIGALDMQIASHALALNAILVTNNTKEFSRVEHLKLENWV